MGKFTQDQLDVARGHLRSQDFDAFRAWMQEHKVVIDHNMVIRTMKKVASVDPEKAVQLFDASFTDMDPTGDRVLFVVRVVALVGAIAFVIATVVHLVSVWMGS